MHLIANPIYGGGWYNARTWWTQTDEFKLGILAESNSDIDASADAIGRPPKSLARKASDLGLVLPKEWRQIIQPKRSPRVTPAPLMNYPYVAKARDEHGDILAINAIIPQNIPDHMRADICQEIMLAILEERTTLEALKANMLIRLTHTGRKCPNM